jgi:hypothetical protein
MKLQFRLAATALALFPVTAWAHGDHTGVHGFLHILTSPAHFGGVLVAGVAAGLVARRLPQVLRRIAEARARRLSDREGQA